MNQSVKDDLNYQDVKKWATNTFIFSIPTLLAFLQGLQTNDFKFALGAAYSAMLCSLIDLLIKYKTGVEATK
ncbi:MAG TPA: hypothetical protein VH186_06185 [Chloroflexia bacterium]|nr:hypothetical protein [Chloroflexia bacterium]